MRPHVLLFLGLASACTTSPDDDGDGSDTMPPIDEGKTITSFSVTSDFKSDFGADPAVTHAIGVLLPLHANPGGVIGKWMSNAAPGDEPSVYAAVGSIVAESPYLAEVSWKLDEITTESAYHTFKLNQDLEIFEKDGKRALRDIAWGATLWSQDVTEAGTSSWAISGPFPAPTFTTDITYRMDGTTLIIDHHRLSLPMRDVIKVLSLGSDTGLALSLWISCNTIATRVAEQVPGVQASAMAAACDAGAHNLGKEFDDAVAAIDGHIEFAISATVTVSDANADGLPETVQSGRWAGSFKTPWDGETVLGETLIKQRTL